MIEVIFKHVSDFFDVKAVIALLALFISIYQVSSSRKHHKLSVKPYLCDWFHHDVDTLSFSFKIQNKGLGTAVISDYYISVNEEKISTNNLNELLKEKLGLDYRLFISELSQQSALSKDEEVFILKVEHTKLEIDSKERNKQISNLMNTVKFLHDNCKVNISYESIYGEKLQYKTITIPW
ncbi:hypothetical protein [Flocculibacter collagenilyticus]|uniref:hypothetical protein n=1 Tax=Flocculibacter collagenilyticus TaxID=2744479 RepID=UPI0018F4A507|nr:hypothetical protein [Flocculibacter collagenilyticus]